MRTLYIFYMYSAEDDDFRNKVQGNDVRGMGVGGADVLPTITSIDTG